MKKLTFRDAIFLVVFALLLAALGFYMEHRAKQRRVNQYLQEYFVR